LSGFQEPTAEGEGAAVGLSIDISGTRLIIRQVAKDGKDEGKVLITLGPDMQPTKTTAVALPLHRGGLPDDAALAAYQEILKESTTTVSEKDLPGGELATTSDTDDDVAGISTFEDESDGSADED